MKQRMEARGLSVVTAASGPEAVQVVAKKTFDAIILDLQMPGMDGIQTLKEILKLDEKAQVILLTGYATPKKGVEAIKHGAVDFLEKPADLQDMLSKIGEAADRRMELVEKDSMDKIMGIIKSRGW